MKTIGLLGGMSWESTMEYYRIINEETQKRAGGSHSAPILLYSFDFTRIETLQNTNKWEELGEILCQQAKIVEKAGADLVLICTNTMHKLAPQVEKSLDIPLLHIADATAREILKCNIHTVGLLGTKFTMEESFYREKLSKEYDLNVVVPIPKEREIIHRIIYDELIKGHIYESSRTRFLEIVGSLEKRGVEGIILGCTEIPLLLKQEHSPIPLFNTTSIHSIAAVDVALG